METLLSHLLTSLTYNTTTYVAGTFQEMLNHKKDKNEDAAINDVFFESTSNSTNIPINQDINLDPPDEKKVLDILHEIKNRRLTVMII